MNELRAGLSVSGAFLLAALLGAAPPVRAQEDASRATPPPGKALVFVFRSERETVAALVPVFVNLARVGNLANGTFAVATVSPGRTFLRVGDQAVATYTLEVAANQSYFVRVEAVPGVRPVQTEVRIVSEVEGRRFLAQMRPVGAAPPAIAAPRVPPPAPVVAPRVPPPPAPVVAPRVPPPPAPVVAAPRVEQPRFFFRAEDGIRGGRVTGVQTCALPISQRAATGKHLVELLQSEKAPVITTVIDKFETAVASKSLKLESPEIFVLVDESHRGQYGARSEERRVGKGG